MSNSTDIKAFLSDGETPSSPPLTSHSKPEPIRAVQSCGHIPRTDLEGLKQARNECLLRMDILEKRIKRYREERDKYRKLFQEKETIKQEEEPRMCKDIPINVKAHGTFAITDGGGSTISEYSKTPYTLTQYKYIDL